MAHDPSQHGFADYFSAASVMPTTAMEEAAPELFGLQLHADMELLGMRGLAAMPAAAAAHQQQPLSLSLCRPDGLGAMALHQHLGGSSSSSRHHHQQQPAAWTHDYSAAPQLAAAGGGAWHLRGSRFLLPAQQLLREFCSLPVDNTDKRATKKPSQEADAGGEGSSSSVSWAPSPQIQAMEPVELQRLKDKLYIMLEEVDRRYRRYCEQMRSVAGGFEAVAGERAAAAYTALASRTISRHFRNLRDGIVAQLQAARKALGEKDVAVPGMTRGDTPRLRVLDQCIRQHKALTQAGIMESHPWRPQRGLPERAVTILRAWLFEHFLHPYPSDVDKHILARQTGLSRSQVSNWFINARVRLWKPMVEEMYVEEMKAEHEQQDGGAASSSGGGGLQNLLINPNPSSSSQQACSEAYYGGRHHGVVCEADYGANNNNNGGGGGVDRKPTREQLVMHDAGSLAAVVNVGGGSIVARAAGPARLEHFGGVMGDVQLDFDAYNDDGGGGGHHPAASFGGVSLTLGLQQQQQHADDDSRDGSGVNIAFGAPSSSGYLFAAGHQQQQQMEGGHHVQFGGAAMDDGDDAAHGQEHYSRSLSAGFHLLRDLAG